MENGPVINITATSNTSKGNEKKSSDSTKEMVLKAVCALLNCGGGIIRIFDSENKSKIGPRAIEQWITNLIGVTSQRNHVKVDPVDDGSQTDGNISIHVSMIPKLITLNYNLYLPLNKQINAVGKTDNIEDIQFSLFRSIIENPVEKGAYSKSNFVFNQPSGVRESDATQLKLVKDTPSESNTLPKRMTNNKNKFVSYISGFANHRGGHIFFGIDDNGVVFGEKIPGKKNKDDIVKTVTETINKLIWTEKRLTPQKGRDWDIDFVEVKDAQGNTVDSTYVVIVFVARCRGGVFIAEPESYFIKDGKVEKMDFDLWWKSFNVGAFSNCVTPSHLTRCSWSSENNRNFFIKLSEKLVDHRDAGDMTGFQNLCDLAVKKFKERNSEPIVTAGQITIAYKSGQFDTAKKLLIKFRDMLGSSQDSAIFNVRFILSQCLVDRSMGNYKESYELSKQGLQLAQNIPTGLCILWLYLECAMNAQCVGLRCAEDVKSFDEKKMEALFYLGEAEKVAYSLESENIPYRAADFRHKLFIYQAFILLNCSVTGEAANITPNEEHLGMAKSYLASLAYENLGRNPLTKFRYVEYHLVHSDYFARLSDIETDGMKNTRYLENALEEASIAKQMALENKDEKKNFDNLFRYAEKRCEVLKKKMDCNDKQDDKNTFEDLKY